MIRVAGRGGRDSLLAMTEGFYVFDTAIGPCGLVWREGGITGVALPERDRAATEARLMRRHPRAEKKAPPADIAKVVEAILALTNGGTPRPRLCTPGPSPAAGVASAGLRHCARNPARRDDDLWPDRPATRRSGSIAGGGTGARRQPLAHHSPLPSGAGQSRKDRRLFRGRGRGHQAETAQHRARPYLERTPSFRRPAALHPVKRRSRMK